MPRYINADLTDTEILDAVQEETADGNTFITVRRILNKLPEADVTPVIHGKWIDNKGLYQCSVCKHIWSELWWTETCPIDRMNKMMRYCPNCGARMDEAKSEKLSTEELKQLLETIIKNETEQAERYYYLYPGIEDNK